MANWFPMALKDGARSWLMNLPEESISYWDKLRMQIITNFKGTRDRATPSTTCDVRSSTLERPSASTFSA